MQLGSKNVLPHGRPSDVRAEVFHRSRELGAGYIPFSVHSIQAEVPSENILAMVYAIRTV